MEQMEVGKPISSMKDLLRKMLEAHCVANNSASENDSQHSDKFIAEMERLTGSVSEACLISLFTFWFDDIMCFAQRYGMDMVRRTPDGTIVYTESTVDNYLIEGKWEVIEIPLPEENDSYWSGGKWVKVNEFDDSTEAPVQAEED